MQVSITFVFFVILFPSIVQTQDWQVLSKNNFGKCVRVSSDSFKWFCEEHIHKGPLYTPLNYTIEDLVREDRIAAMNLLTGLLDHCWTDIRHVVCGFVFAPCSNTENPSPSGLCKSACENLNHCNSVAGNKGDATEFCQMSMIVDNTNQQNGGEIICGNAGTFVFSFVGIFVNCLFVTFFI